MKNHKLESFKNYSDVGSREMVLEKFDAISREIGVLARRTVELQPPDDGDAVAVFIGMDERARLEAAVKLWSGGAYRYLLVGGSNPKEQGHPSEIEIRERIDSLGGDVRGKNIHILPEAEHTKDQSDWLASMADELNMKRLVMVEPDYHTPRVYATTVASMNTRGVTTPLWTAPIDYPVDFASPHPRNPGVRQTPMFMAGEDARRIPIYQKTGDVASNEAWEKHIKLSKQAPTS